MSMSLFLDDPRITIILISRSIPPTILDMKLLDESSISGSTSDLNFLFASSFVAVVVRRCLLHLRVSRQLIQRGENDRQIYVVSVPVLHSLLGYLMLVGLRFSLYDVHRSLKWSLSCFHYRYTRTCNEGID